MLCHHKQTNIPSVAEMTNYEMKTTFWTDFNIADRFGLDAIEDTYKRAFDEWKDDKVYATELVLVLNWKSWEHCADNKDGVPVADEIGSWYANKYYELKDWILENWSKNHKDWLGYFVQTID